MKTIFEPFRIKSVEPIKITTKLERASLIKAAHYNLFALHSNDVMIDLLTDSGTGAMSAEQWASLMRGDESYAGSPSYYQFENAIKELMPFKHVIPTHQGRAAESILYNLYGGINKKIPNNTHFDTTRANIESTGAEIFNLVIPEGKDPTNLHPFKGNMDIKELERFLITHGDDVTCIITTITNNAGGGQPVSLQNIKETSDLASKYGKPFFIDGCRFAENAWFIKKGNWPTKSINKRDSKRYF